MERLRVDHRVGPDLVADGGLDELALDLDVVGQDPAVDTGTQVPDHIASIVEQADPDPAIGPTVLIGDDQFLGDIDQPTSQVTRVRRSQGRVGQTLSCPVSGDEVLQDRQALTEVRNDRPRDDVTLRVGN